MLVSENTDLSKTDQKKIYKSFLSNLILNYTWLQYDNSNNIQKKPL